MSGTEYIIKQTVSYFQIDGKREMTPAALLASLQEAAISHADSLGYTLEYMGKNQWGWAVINWHLKIARMPAHKEEITLHTWSDSCRKFQATRSFYILDQGGRRILEGASRWVFMDLEKRKPGNVPEEMIKAYSSGLAPALEGEKFLMPKGGGEEKAAERTFTITRRDTDTNGHANNVKYMEWAMDDVPDEIYDTMKLKDVRIAYRKECVRGDEITMKTSVTKTEEGKEVLTFLTDGRELVFAEVATIWI